jgi:hypothetical protein
MTEKGTFAWWQPIYADYNIPTFPLREDKRPAIRGFNKVGLRGSAQLAFKFIEAPAIGFMCGDFNKIAVGDIDATEERVLADFLSRHGDTPIIALTASGKFHAWYRFNGELRSIRPWPGLPIDILGANGFVVAPPSKVGGGEYQFIRGDLIDIDRLPVMQNLDPDLYIASPQKLASAKLVSPMRGLRAGDGRNKELFRTIGPIAREVYAENKGIDVLLDAAMKHNRDCEQPLAIEEVGKIVKQVWKMTTEHRNWIGRGSDRRTEVFSFITGNIDAFGLLEFLRVNEGASARFWIANGLAETFGWDRKRLARARDCLIDLGYIRQIKQAWSGSPAEYIWP